MFGNQLPEKAVLLLFESDHHKDRQLESSQEEKPENLDHSVVVGCSTGQIFPASVGRWNKSK